jgi:hypothetical protein
MLCPKRLTQHVRWMSALWGLSGPTSKRALHASRFTTAGRSVRCPVQSSGTALAFISLMSHLPLTRIRPSSELVWAAMLFFALST